jgi:hypothetical protein
MVFLSIRKISEDKLLGKTQDLSLAPYTLPLKKGLSMIVSFNVQEQSDFRNR